MNWQEQVKKDYNKAVVEFWRENPDKSFDDAAKHGEKVVRENNKSGCYGIIGWLFISTLMTQLYLNLKAIFTPDEPSFDENYVMGLRDE